MASMISPERSQMKIPMMLASTRRRILASRSREIAVQAGILQRDRRLRGEQLQHRDPGRRKNPRSQVVLEIEHPDELGLVEQRQAENGASLVLTDVADPRKTGSESRHRRE